MPMSRRGRLAVATTVFLVVTLAAGAAGAATGTLWTLGIICVVPQGLVPIAFNLFGVDPQVKVWFAARYLPQRLQVPAALGFIVVGALACWLAETIRRRQSPQP
jgi:hypothetical protein